MLFLYTQTPPVPVERENYIDSLQVDLKMTSKLAPAKAQEEADDIVDRHVVPPVESVLEDLGREMDVSIPRLEIDVGRVRLEDLRDAVESALRNALERYRTSYPSSSPTLADSLREYAEAGIVPWENGAVPFSPSRFLEVFLEDESDTVLASIASFSEKERVGLFLATFSEVAPEEKRRVLQIREAVLAALAKDHPETAAVLSARMEAWRRFAELIESLSASAVEASEATVADTSEAPEERVVFRYVEVALDDIPEGTSLVSMDYKDAPVGEDPEYIVVPGLPLKYYRKVTVIIPTDTVEPAAPESGTSMSETAVSKPETVVSKPESTVSELETSMSGSETAMTGPGTPAHASETGVPGPTSPDGGSAGPEERVGETDGKSKASDDTAMHATGLEGTVETKEEATDHMQEAEMEGPARYRYVEIDGAFIPEGYSVVTVDSLENPDELSPEYVVTSSSPRKYYRKVSVDGMEERPVPGENGSETWTNRPLETEADKPEAGRREPVTTAETKGKTVVVSYRYVPVDLEDIPEGIPVAPREFTDAPGVNDPEFIVTVGPPRKYFRKVAVGILAGSAETSEHGPAASAYVAEPSTFNDESTEGGSDSLESGSEPMTGELEEAKESVEEQAADRTKEAKTGREERVGTREREPEKEATALAVDGRAEGGFQYVEIALTEIPEGVSVVAMDPMDASGANDPEYIVSIGPRMTYYRKVAREVAGGSEGGPGIPAAPETAATFLDEPEIWAVRDFESEVPDARIPVSDAGLVLLHPFIGRMMENLGLVKKGAFVSPLARIRAVHLLRDLTGSDEPHHNHNLILEKILCGLPVGYLLPPEWKPTEREKEEMEGLLRAVCDYWKPLSRSSTAALCGSFIHRAGTVEPFQDTWTVRVEGRTIDILLDDLPWELSIIYLPWLEQPIAVEWERE